MIQVKSIRSKTNRCGETRASEREKRTRNNKEIKDDSLRGERSVYARRDMHSNAAEVGGGREGLERQSRRKEREGERERGEERK